MGANIYIYIVLVSLGICYGSTKNQLKADDEFHILDRIIKLEQMQTRYDQHGRDLENKVKTLEVQNAMLQREVERKNQLMKNSIREQEEKIGGIWSRLNSLHNSNPRLHQRQIDPISRVAFSAFLDHDIDNLGPDQVIVFNQVQLNEGMGYNKHTGAFTAPVSGIYVFTFFIGERDSNQLYVKLVVNGMPKSDAVVETNSSYDDAQGGNVVVLKVTKGDAVMIEHNTYGSHIEGFTDLRISTFSGFLLYPIEQENNVIGK